MISSIIRKPIPEHATNPLKYKFSWSVLGVLSPVEIPFDLLKRGLERYAMRITREQLPWDAGDHGAG